MIRVESRKQLLKSFRFQINFDYVAIFVTSNLPTSPFLPYRNMLKLMLNVFHI